MGVTTGISWTDSTVNFWRGCDKVSPGCAHCYMFRDQTRYGRNPAEVVRQSDAKFYEALRWPDGRRIFTCSWSDFWHPKADPWRADAWDVIRRTPQHAWQILTKRPERILDHLPPDWGDGWPHVWIGTSVENQRFARERIPLLEAVPARVRFLSLEPLLGPVDLRSCLHIYGHTGPPCCSDREGYHRLGGAPSGIHWVIVGGESGGPRERQLVAQHPIFGWIAREQPAEWVRSLRDQCVAAGVAFHFKQFGGPRPESGGRILDGRTWDEFPDQAVADRAVPAEYRQEVLL